MKNMRLIIGVVAAVIVIVVGAILAAPLLDGAFSGSSNTQAGEQIEWPENAAGETYGSPIAGTAPDLIAALSDDGELGYVRVSELDLERNAAKSTTNPDAVFSIAVYESDGTTVVGSLTITKDTPGARDGFN